MVLWIPGFLFSDGLICYVYQYDELKNIIQLLGGGFVPFLFAVRWAVIRKAVSNCVRIASSDTEK